ncbi:MULTISPECIES: hypothetical protein [unclassified Exiguobacterium]|uniref:hypothetical protein n=1 Tax=unclassified Exiguobacterium TaxID=2644629 RepID=UPI001BE8F0A9|nr:MULTISPECIES: hypothetical protein [unclassified Exiguobacterium]
MGGIFLLIGIFLSVLSRWLEFEGNSTLGDVMLFPAIFFMAIAFLCSFPYFKEWWEDRSTRKKALLFVMFAAVGILCLQAAFWFVVWRDQWLGLLLVLPFVACATFIARLFK